MSDLIERLERAEAGSRELDVAICLLLVPNEAQPNGGWRYWPTPDSEVSSIDPRRVTTSLDAALALAERVLPDHDWSVGCLPVSDDADYEEHHSFGALLYSRYTRPYDTMAHGATPALALVTAVLKAQGAQQ